MTRIPFSRAHAPEAAAGLCSLVFSAVALLPRPLPNNDGILYILSAGALLENGTPAAGRVHLWPFYPALLAAVSALSGLSVESAAHVTGSFLLAVTSALFVALTRELGGSRRVAWCAALTILCHPWLNRARILIVREEAAWAFSLLALLLLLRSQGGRRKGALAGWAVSGVLAVLSRPETVILMAAAPLAVAHASELTPRVRRSRALVLCVPAALAAAVTLTWLTREPSRYNDLLALEALTDASRALAAAFPLPFGREYAPFIVASGLLFIPVVKTLKTMGLAHLGLAVIGGATGMKADRFQRTVLGLTLAASIIPLYVQTFRLLFVESRYTVLTTLLLSIAAPFGLVRFFDEETPGRRRLVGLGLVMALVATAFANFPLRSRSENQTLAAADWIRVQAPGAALHTGSLQLAYRSGARVDWGAIQQAQITGQAGAVQASTGDLWSVYLAPNASVPATAGSPADFSLVASFPYPGEETLALYRCGAPVCRGVRR